MYILDTDHVGILQRGTGPEYLALSRRISRQSQTDLYVTIVSFHEQLLGWNAYIARAKSQAESNTASRFDTWCSRIRPPTEPPKPRRFSFMRRATQKNGVYADRAGE